MRVRTILTIAIALMAYPVLFTAGAWPVLAFPQLEQYAPYLLPAIIAIALILSPVAGWFIAPRMRLRFWQQKS